MRSPIGVGLALLAATTIPFPARLHAATLPLSLVKAEVAGESVYPEAAAVPPMVWNLAGPVLSWRPGGGVQRAATGDALQLTVGDSGGELVSPDLALSASGFGRLVVRFGTPPKLAEADATLHWTRADGTAAARSLRLAVEAGADGEYSAAIDLESSLHWYGRISTLALRFPRTTDGSPISVRSVRIEPRRASYTLRTRVEIKEVEFAKEVSPFQARGGLFLPPASRFEMTSAPAEVLDLRFGLGVVGAQGATVIGRFTADFTTTLTVSVFDTGSDRLLAERRVPVVVQSSRWLDFALPLRAVGTTALRVVFEYRDETASTVALVSKPRLTTRAVPRITVLTTIDALRKTNLSIYGYSRRTPSIDQIGREGYVFTRAYSQANNTPTAIIALMNSEYPENAPWDGPRPGRPSLAQFLSDQSVYTVEITANPFLQEPHIATGFDEVVYVSSRGRHTSADVEREMTRVLEAHGGEDLLLYAHFLDPHAPYNPPPHTAGRYARASDALAAAMATSLDPWVYRDQYVEIGLNTSPVVPKRALSAAAVQRIVDLYDEELLDVDLHLGAVWDRMKDLGMYQGALLVVSADHGEEFYEHDGVQHGAAGLYEEIVRVPLVIKPPRGSPLASGRPRAPIDTLVQHIDLYPTIVESMGLTPPTWISGHNVFEVARGYAISEWMQVPGWRRRSITDGDYKLISGEENVGGRIRADPPLLFRLSTDPSETQNLAPQEPDRVSSMRRRLREAIAGSGKQAAE